MCSKKNFDQLLRAARKVHVVYFDQLLGAAHYIHFISNHNIGNRGTKNLSALVF